MFIKIRRDTLIILLLAFILILCGRLITYVAFASSNDVNDGIPISGVIIRGNDIVPVDTIRSNVMQSGLRDGSVIYGDVLKNSSRYIYTAYYCCRCSSGQKHWSCYCNCY